MNQLKAAEEMKLYPPRFNFEVKVVVDKGTTITEFSMHKKSLSYEINGGITILCGTKPTGIIFIPSHAGM